MKKIYILIITFISIQCFSQSDYSRYYNSWRLGLNLGGAWQTADYRSCWGMAGGFTLEKGLHENSTNFFSFAIRGRYLAANTYGMDYSRNYDVKSNDAYNGKYDPAVNFVDSVSANRQYVFDNYKMTLGEGSLELQLTFNRLRERTHVLLNLWGGVGVTSYRTKSDLLDGKNKMYNFSLVDSTGNKTKALNSYNGLIDKNYESYAYGSRNGNLVTFSPSAGLGLGYQFSPGFSMLWEYKVTFPQGTNADLLDGKLSVNHDAIGGSNDYYHYTGLNLVFTLRGKHKTPKQETAVQTPIPTNTVPVTTPSVTPTASIVTNPSVIPTHTAVNTTPVPIEPKPVITFITPPSNGFIVDKQLYKITAQILNVVASNKIQLKLNGVGISNFTYNSQSHILEYTANLIKGSNAVQIMASNNAGADNKVTTIIYEQPKPAGNLPVVSFINPVQAGTTVLTQTYSVKAQVLNVEGKNSISVYFNGISTPFEYNASTKQIVFAASLISGSNAISITANNAVGEDTKTSSVIFKEIKVNGIPPMISFLSPATENSATDKLLYNFKVSVLNVVSKNNISLTLNGNAINGFSYNMESSSVDFSEGLVVGDNVLIVKANNTFGTDSKTVHINYQAQVVLKTPPTVLIINPANSPAASLIPNYVFKAKVTNVTSKKQLVVKFNGAIVPNYALTLPTIICPVTLISGNNIFEVTATNSDGTDSKNVIVNYKPKEAPILPLINLIDPASTLNNTENASYSFKLSVLNVLSKSDIEVVFNGVMQPSFTYDPANKELLFQTNLSVGDNSLFVKATNQSGSDSKQIIVKYTPRIKIKSLPFVTITNPATANNLISNPNFIFKATITNIENTTGLAVKLNGNTITNYTYDGFNLSCPASLLQGNNIFEIKATNNDGSDIKSATVNYKVKTIPVPPVVSLISPSSEANATENLSYNFKLSVLHVNSKADIEVLFNGSVQSNFTFDAATKELSFQTNLVIGENTLLVKGTNQFGSDFKQIKVTYSPHVEIKVPPAIVFTNPNNGAGSSHNTNYIFKASITNVPNTNGLTVKFNGSAVSNFSYDGITLSYPVTLNPGINTLEITVINSDGNDVKRAVVNYRPKVEAVIPPIIMVFNPVNTPTVTIPNYDFQFKVTNVTKSQIEVSLNGIPNTTFGFANSLGNFTNNLISGINTLTIKATNSAGTVTKSENVFFLSVKDSINNVPVGTPTGDPDEKKITICHIPPGNHQNPQTITIPVSALAAHLAHGDTEGECPSKSDSSKVVPRPLKNLNQEEPEKVITTPRKPR